jgi:transposase
LQRTAKTKRKPVGCASVLSFVQDRGVAGRPSKLTAERRDDLTLVLAEGVPVGVAARSVGVSPRSLRRWLAEGDLRERVAELRSARRVQPDAISEARLALLILKASEHDWRASAWWLERRWPERWGAERMSDIPVEPLEGATGMSS